MEQGGEKLIEFGGGFGLRGSGGGGFHLNGVKPLLCVDRGDRNFDFWKLDGR